MARRQEGKRVPLTVTHDDDGGLTIHDQASGLVVSVIATHPLVNGPKGLVIEVYDYHGQDVLMEDAVQMRRGRRDDEEDAPVRLVVAHHPTVSFYPSNER